MSETNQLVASHVDADSSRRATLLFVRMWAVAHILHLIIANQAALDTPFNLVVVALALSVVLRPASGRLLSAMAVAQLIEYAVDMPFSPDHWAVISLVNIALLVTMLARWSTDLSTLREGFPAARMVLLTAYGAAALSKWNSSFLDPVTSCANAIAKIVSFGAVGPIGDRHVLSHGVAITETLVFVFLAVPRTRAWGVMLGVTFHFCLSATPSMVVGDFTSTVYALFFLFLAPEATSNVLDRVSGWAGRSRIVKDARRRPPVTACLFFVLVGLGGHLSPNAAMSTLYVLEQFYFLPLLIATGLAVRSSEQGASFGRVRFVHLPVLVLAIAWALNPYLGLRTTGSFTMFSNLRTESPHPNHLFMPSWRLTDWQDQMVTLQSSNDVELTSGGSNRLAVPLLALRRMATDDPDLEVTGILHGRTMSWGPGDGQVKLEPLPWWQYKLVLLRPVTTDGRPFCSAS